LLLPVALVSGAFGQTGPTPPPPAPADAPITLSPFLVSAADRTDTYNVESVGSGRGPNAILFGTGTAGGVLNLRTKSADASTRRPA
jgi:outer membrane receptor protein involved in Fe transport